MANSNITVGGKVNVYFDIPADLVITSAQTALTGAKNGGQLTTDGLSFNRSATTEVISSNNEGTQRTIYTDSEITIGGTFLEDTPDVHKFVLGVESLAGVFTDDGKSSYNGGIVVDVVDAQLPNGNTRLVRYWVPSGQVTANDETTINSSSGVQYGWTFTAYGSDKIDGGKYRRFTLIVDEDGNPVTTEDVTTSYAVLTLDVPASVQSGSTLSYNGTTTEGVSAVNVHIFGGYTDGATGNSVPIDENVTPTLNGTSFFGDYAVPAGATGGEITLTAGVSGDASGNGSIAKTVQITAAAAG